MNQRVELTAGDGHRFDAYVASPEGAAIAALVVVQEIFGVNAHIRSVADAFAREGFYTVAPALFDRVEKNVELGYQGDDFERAMALARKLDIGNAVKDVDAALNYAHTQTGLPVGVLGYCYGGTLAWLSATRLQPGAAVGYYGGQIAKFVQENPRAPVMLHFGLQDAHIPKEDVAQVRAAHPEVEIYTYEAGHGFNCSDRASYNPEAARQAFHRSLQFLKKHLS